MTIRITIKDLETQAEELNRQLGLPPEASTYNVESKRTEFNPGAYQIRSSQTGHSLLKICNKGGAETDVLYSPGGTVRELYYLINAYRAGIAASENQAGGVK